MKRTIAIVICVLFLTSGLIRIGVGGIMIGQSAGWWALGGEVEEALADTERFIGERESNLVGFTPMSYFAFIIFMGLSISLGAIGQIWRRQWGLALIVLYLFSHAALFINFMTINPKVTLLALAISLTLVLWWANRTDEPGGELVPGQ
jgi:hypothetical protein